jgi:hypothetical protein
MDLSGIYASIRGYGRSLLELSRLMLSIINGLMLLRFYLRDRARLMLHSIHPDTYQWWFHLPTRQFEGKPTRRYGFVAYVAIQNSGLRKTQLTSWRLSIRTRLGRTHELRPLSMPEPSANIGEHTKLYPVLGQRGLHFDGETVIDAGCSISGMVYYIYECYGGGGWGPDTTDQQINATFRVSDGFRSTSRCSVRFTHKSLEEIKAFAPGIDMIDAKQMETDGPEC